MLQRYSAAARRILTDGLSRAHNFSNKNSKKGGAVIYRPSLSLFKQLAVNIHGVVVKSYLSMKKVTKGLLIFVMPLRVVSTV